MALSNRNVYALMASKLWRAVDTFATELVHSDKSELLRKRWGQKPVKSPLLSPEEDVKQLITSAVSLHDIWLFLQRRLKNGSDLDFLCFSILDETGECVRIRFWEPLSESAEASLPLNAFELGNELPSVSMLERKNHFVHAYTRKDTTFSPSLSDLGAGFLSHLGIDADRYPALNIFSVPLIAGNRAIAMVTLGFSDLDAFSQAKLSYMYTIRDQIAQLVWNLILQERMKIQSHVDNLTGLPGHSYFQRVLEVELDKADKSEAPLTVMILDINNIQEINENLGHQMGDEAICHLASTVRHLVRGLDTVARYGADEVAVALPETDPKTADEIADRFIQGIRERMPKGCLKGLSISIGYATYPTDTPVRDGVMKQAEQALHLAKFKGAKTGTSTRIASREMDLLNDKTVLEVFASHIAKKYNTHGPSVFQELVRRIESQEEGEASPEDLMLETIGSLAGALDAKDKYTRGHSQAVANYAVAVAHALELSAEDVEQVRLAAFLHDIGKIGIPESILCKNGPLNEREWEIMKQHPVIGARQILAPVSALKDVIPMVEFHHENWDGSGYPSGLAGEAIPLGARIVSIVDAFHGLTSDRSYRKALTVIEAKGILESGSGTKWDPNLLQVFFKILNIAASKA